MKIVRPVVLLFTALAVLLSSTALAATPDKGTISKKKKSVSWTGTLTISIPVNDCVQGSDSPECDYFYLKVDAPDGARVRVVIPAPSAVSDIDLYVYAANGAQVANSGNIFGETEVAEWRHSARFRNKPYEVRVQAYLVPPGTAYKGTASLR